MIDLKYGHDYYKIDGKYVLEETLAENLKVNRENVCLMNGANGGLQFLLNVIANEFRINKKIPKAILDFPNYFYTLKFLESNKYKTIFIKRNKNFDFPIKEFIYNIKKQKPNLIILTSPNNPFGLPISDINLNKIINSAKKDQIILIDRACVNIAKHISTKDLLNKYRNKKIIVLHSYSKTHNLASKRVGYYVTNNTDVAKMLRNQEDHCRVNYDAITALQKALKNKKVVKESINNIKNSLKIIAEFKKNHKDFCYSNSKSNFIVIVGNTNIFEKLRKTFIFLDNKPLQLPSNCCRLNISDPKKVKLFFKEYEKLENEIRK